SGIFHPRDPIDGGRERLPGFALRYQNLFTFRGQAVVAAAALPGLIDPVSDDTASPLEPGEQGVERRYVERKHAYGSALDKLADFVPVASPILDQGKKQQFGASFLQFPVQHGVHICLYNIWLSNLYVSRGC